MRWHRRLPLPPGAQDVLTATSLLLHRVIGGSIGLLLKIEGAQDDRILVVGEANRDGC
jgi:hypothetical protein